VTARGRLVEAGGEDSPERGGAVVHFPGGSLGRGSGCSVAAKAPPTTEASFGRRGCQSPPWCRFGHTRKMSKLNHTESIVVARSPEDLYDLVSDVTRMGEWSPVCKACWWDEGAGPAEGAWVHREERVARANLGDAFGGRSRRSGS
jgi:hypothetical protein